MLVQFEKKFDQVDIRLNNDKDITTCDLYVSGEANVYEEMYGEDADGNRGVKMRTVEDVVFHQIVAMTEAGMIEISLDAIEKEDARHIEIVCEDLAYENYGNRSEDYDRYDKYERDEK